MALNFHHVGFGAAFEAEWFRDEAQRVARGLATTPTVAEVEASGTVPAAMVAFVKERQAKLREAYHAEQDARRISEARERLNARTAPKPTPKAPEPKRR